MLEVTKFENDKIWKISEFVKLLNLKVNLILEMTKSEMLLDLKN